MAKAFIDTNILACAVDYGEPEKNEIARRLLDGIAQTGEGIVSTQVLQEFYNVATKRLKHRPQDVRGWISALPYQVVGMTRELIIEGIDISVVYRTAFYDGLIVAAAASAKCAILYSEDMQHGMRFGKLRVVNPFNQ